MDWAFRDEPDEANPDGSSLVIWLSFVASCVGWCLPESSGVITKEGWADVFDSG